MEQADFFISYNKADVHWATGIGDWLDRAGLSTILQAQDFVAGSNFVSEMHKRCSKETHSGRAFRPIILEQSFPKQNGRQRLPKIRRAKTERSLRCECGTANRPGYSHPSFYIDLVGLNPTDAQKKLLSEIQASLSGRRATSLSPRRKLKRLAATPDAESSGSIRQTIFGDNNTQVAGDYVENQEGSSKNIVQPDHRHIDEATAFEIKRLVDFLAEIDVLAGRSDSHSGWFSRLYRRYRVTSYRPIPTAASVTRRKPRSQWTRTHSWSRRLRSLCGLILCSSVSE